MIKALTLLALVGALGTPTLADRLRSGVAMPPQALPPFSAPTRYGDEGADSGGEGPGDYPWALADGRLFTVDYRYGWEGGEGGEGGEGYYANHPYEGGEGGEGGEGYYAIPTYGANLPPVAIPCGSNRLIGTLLGAAAGGFAGSKIGKGDGQLAAVAAGTVLGAFLGHEIGASLGEAD
ncbi:MAG: glycine zipper 2TM domain-containing protein, partial [Kiloniellaceae bacterium]